MIGHGRRRSLRPRASGVCGGGVCGRRAGRCAAARVLWLLLLDGAILLFALAGARSRRPPHVRHAHGLHARRGRRTLCTLLDRRRPRSLRLAAGRAHVGTLAQLGTLEQLTLALQLLKTLLKLVERARACRSHLLMMMVVVRLERAVPRLLWTVGVALRECAP